MPDYTLFTNPMSRGQIARWALLEAGAEYQQRLTEWGPPLPELLALNPMGKVPTLVHHHGGHDHVVTEAAAICHYLAEMSAPDLLPRQEEKADYFRYLFFAAGPMEQAITAQSMGWRPDGPQKEGMAGFGSFERAVGTFEKMLNGRDYVCGDRFTMADVYVGAQVDWGLQFNTLPERETFTVYAGRLRQREGYQATKKIDNALIAELQNG